MFYVISNLVKIYKGFMLRGFIRFHECQVLFQRVTGNRCQCSQDMTLKYSGVPATSKAFFSQPIVVVGCTLVKISM